MRDTWKQAAADAGALDFEQFWRTAVHDGVVAGHGVPAEGRDGSANVFAAIGAAAGLPRRASSCVLRADPTVYDGRFANNGWLQELPKPFTKLTWDNTRPAQPGDGRAPRRRATRTSSSSRVGGRSVQGPAWIVPGQADDTVTVHLGYGRTRAGRVGNGIGFNAYAAAHDRGACGRRRASQVAKTTGGRHAAGEHAAAPRHGGPRDHPRRHARAVSAGTRRFVQRR